MNRPPSWRHSGDGVAAGWWATACDPSTHTCGREGDSHSRGRGGWEARGGAAAGGGGRGGGGGEGSDGAKGEGGKEGKRRGAGEEVEGKEKRGAEVVVRGGGEGQGEEGKEGEGREKGGEGGGGGRGGEGGGEGRRGREGGGGPNRGQARRERTDAVMEALIVRTMKCRQPGRRTGDANYGRQDRPESHDDRAHRRTFGLKPHLTRTFKLSPDPQLIEKVRDVVGLYMHSTLPRTRRWLRQLPQRRPSNTDCGRDSAGLSPGRGTLFPPPPLFLHDGGRFGRTPANGQ